MRLSAKKADIRLWELLHDLVAATRTEAEHNHPRVFRRYEALCEDWGECPRQARILEDGRRGKRTRENDG